LVRPEVHARKLGTLYKIFRALKVSCTSELRTDTAVGHLHRGQAVGLFSTGSEHAIIPFHAGREKESWKDLFNTLRNYCHSQ
jgi:hypothetical protein